MFRDGKDSSLPSHLKMLREAEARHSKKKQARFVTKEQKEPVARG